MSRHNIDGRLERLLSVLEIAPLMAFVFVRTFGFAMPHRIFIGGALSILIFCLLAWRRARFTPLYFSTNVFFVMVSAILILPFASVANLFLALGEVGMFLTIFVVVCAWHISSPGGLFSCDQVPFASKKYSRVLLVIYAICPAISLYFKGNENLAGALPFIILTVAEKTLIFCQARETKRNLQYAE